MKRSWKRLPSSIPNSYWSSFLYMDVMTVCLLAFHLGFLFRLIGVGATLKHHAKDGQFILQSKPWMRRATFLRAGGLCLVSVADQSSATTGGLDGFRIAPSVVNDKSDTTCMCACLTF